LKKLMPDGSALFRAWWRKRWCWQNFTMPKPYSSEAGVIIGRLHETLQLEIIAVIESLEQLKESAEYELCGIAEQKPGVLDELASERIKLLEKESAELQQQAEKFADEIKELSGERSPRII
jgi:hypothetical protein